MIICQQCWCCRDQLLGNFPLRVVWLHQHALRVRLAEVPSLETSSGNTLRGSCVTQQRQAHLVGLSFRHSASLLHGIDSPADVACLLPAVVQEAALEDLSGEDKQLWEDGLQQLRDIGMDDKLAEKSLKRGFGWSSQAYWWKQKVKEVPQSGEVSK